jgi:hypothetical protein
MKTYFLDIIPKIIHLSKKLNIETNITNKHWILINENDNSKKVFIFCNDKSLIVSTDGIVDKGYWKIINPNTILIEFSKSSFLFKHAFIDNDVLILKLDGIDEFCLFINEDKILANSWTIDNTIKHLENEYLPKPKAITPKYYYLSKGINYGPYSLNQIKSIVDRGEISKMCFVRKAYEKDYSSKNRIVDLLLLNNL